LLAGAAAALVLLSGCQKKATGQVAAVVNGEEISIAELNAELQGAKIPDTVDKKKLMSQVLQRVIDRKVMVQRAKDQGLDKDPQFLIQQRRANDNLLVSLLGRQAAKGISVPDQGTIDKYIADHPSIFAQRARYTVDQIQFAVPADMSVLKPLEADHTLDAVGKHLDDMKIKYSRAKMVMDSAAVPQEAMAKIAALPQGEPFVIPAGGKMTANVIINKEAVTTPPDIARQEAAELLRRQQLSEALAKQVKTARDSAKIEYQPGYEPAKADAKPAS
jgi:EpsD family peptidyl-prolyl cis-trans isomerase